MAKRKLSRKEVLLEELATIIAGEHFEVNQECYRDEAAEYADEGVTEAMYMAGSGEHIHLETTESVGHNLADMAAIQYEKMVRAKFPRVKAKDFVW